jgi:hypothetical protein
VVDEHLSGGLEDALASVRPFALAALAATH